jgi:hypothetical protein
MKDVVRVSFYCSLRERLAGFGLELHPEKTKVVYRKSWNGKEKNEHNSITFLSNSFRKG